MRFRIKYYSILRKSIEFFTIIIFDFQCQISPRLDDMTKYDVDNILRDRLTIFRRISFFILIKEIIMLSLSNIEENGRMAVASI
jgi:hypothetical protein